MALLPLWKRGTPFNIKIKEPKMIFRTICAWCGRTLKEEPCTESIAQLAVNPETNVIISHGICPDCRRRIEQNEFQMQGGDNDA